SYQRSLQEAAKIKALAEADAEREARIGIARALAVEEQVRAYGGPQFQVLQQAVERFRSAVGKAGLGDVPKMVITGGGNGASNGNIGGGSYSAFEGLIAMLLSEKLQIDAKPNGHAANGNDEVKRIRQSILQGLAEHRSAKEDNGSDSALATNE